MKYLIGSIIGITLMVAGAVWYTSADASTTHLAEFKQPFTEDAFRSAQANDQLILIDVYATWCPTCRRQQGALDDYFSENPDSELVVFEVDYDDQKEWVRYFEAPRQSTLVLYRGEERLWFSVAQTNKNAIFAELKPYDSGAK